METGNLHLILIKNKDLSKKELSNKAFMHLSLVIINLFGLRVFDKYFDLCQIC